VPLGNATGSCVGFTITGSSITVALLPLAHRRRLWSFFVGKGLRLGGHARGGMDSKTDENRLVFTKTNKTGPVWFCQLTENRPVELFF
jgi:hypothetical protein